MKTKEKRVHAKGCTVHGTRYTTKGERQTANKLSCTVYRVPCTLLLLFLFSCTAPIDIPTDDAAPVIVVNGILTDELKQQEVRISRSAPYFQDRPDDPLSEAVVTIESSVGEVFELMENDTVKGLYQTASAWAVVPGLTYRLNVRVDFNNDGTKENYQAETTILAPVPIDSSKIVPMNIVGNHNYSLRIYAQDPPEKDFYLLKFLINDSLITTKISRYVTYDDEAVNGQYFDGMMVRFFASIEDWENDTEDRRKRSDYLSPGDVVGMRMGRISKGYHDFINQCQKEMRGENPIFGGPASNIISNISNGGVGYFTGYCITSSSTKVP